ncbi:Fc receptor-like protein 5 isoform X3 [Clupea harengus]|uniref:Fc receptor-like protein 5 isoform X3 n=1 Tax=Clupea harengus TaxID=7950 RepID=A0A6P8FRU6_CLUHA|nr:Fc receptor-like protein 5 isoform X3 [Clupea harengus]
MMACLQVVTVFLAVSCCICQDSNAFRLRNPILRGPATALRKSIVDFHCMVERDRDDDRNLFYELYKVNDTQSKGMFSTLDNDQPEAKFPVWIKPTHEGYYYCKASVQNRSEVMPTYSSHHYLAVIEPVEGAHVRSDPSPHELFEGTTLRLSCSITKGSHVSYTWFFNGRPVVDGIAQNTMSVHNTTITDSGDYVCFASNAVENTSIYTSNSSTSITIKEIPREVKVSFTVVKERDGHYWAQVVCRSVGGTPPITFALFNNSEGIDEQNTEHLNATFLVPIDLDQHMGELMCQASNGKTPQHSSPMRLEAVRVGGALVMTYERIMDDNFQVIRLQFHCQVERGTLPLYRWFLNNVPLTMRGPSHWVWSQDNSTLLVDLNPTSNRLPVMVVAVVFGCFFFLVTVLTGCCFYGIYKWKHNPDKLSRQNGRSTEMDDMKATCISEGNKDCGENTSVAKEVGADDLEGEYVDEWPEIEEPWN